MKLKIFKKRLICFRNKQIQLNTDQVNKMIMDWRKEEGRRASNCRQIIYKIKVFRNSKRYWPICKVKFNNKWRTHQLNMVSILFYKIISKVLKVDTQFSINLKSKIYFIKNISLITLEIWKQNLKVKKYNSKMIKTKN